MATRPPGILRRLSWHTLAAAGSTAVLVAVLVIAPGGTRAAAVFETLRAPGEAGFIAGHRGGVDAPENTLEAMRQAISGPAEFVETDVQLTADGVPVLFHDWTVDRTTNGTGPVWAHTFQELRRLDAGSWYGPEFAAERVPSLEEFLHLLAPSAKKAILELKGSWNPKQVDAIADALYSAGVQDRVILASFSLTTLQHLHERSPGIARAVITRQVVGDPAVLAGACGAIAIVTSRSFLQRDPEAVDRIHAAGLGVLAYTLNGQEGWAGALALGVDGIITDHTADLGSWLARTP